MDKQLRIIAGAIISESNLSKAAKIQMLKFVKEEASDSQVKALLMDGKIVNLDEQSEEIVNDRFDVSEAGGRVAQIRKTAMSRAGTQQGIGAAMWAIYRKIRSKYDVCTKRCGTFELNTSRRQYCMLQCKVAKLTGLLSAAKKAGKEKEVAKYNSQLAKAKQAMQKMKASYAKRGAKEPS